MFLCTAQVEDKTQKLREGLNRTRNYSRDQLAVEQRLDAYARELAGFTLYSGLSSSVRSSRERFEELRGVGQRLHEDLTRLTDTTRLLQASSLTRLLKYAASSSFHTIYCRACESVYQLTQ